MRILLSVSVLVAALAVLALLAVRDDGQPAEAHHGSTPGVIDYVAIDADPFATPANTATSLGSRETCVSASVGDLIRIDITEDEVAGDEDLKGWQATLLYDPTIVNVAAVDDTSLHTFLSGGLEGILFSLTAAPSDDVLADPDAIPEGMDGSMTIAAAILGPSTKHTGEGVVARVTLEAVGLGASNLTLSDVKFARVKEYAVVQLSVGTVIHAATAIEDPDGCQKFAADDDLDGICNQGATSAFCAGSDNCQWTKNPGQENIVHPGTVLGDACEDPDFDRLPDSSDNCPDAYNPVQLDGNADGIGDDCTADLAMLSALSACSVAGDGLVFTCANTAGVVNLGPRGTQRARGAVNVGFPSDCWVQDYSTEGQGFGTLWLDASISQTISKQFQITCSEDGPHQIVACATVELDSPMVIDPNSNNNFTSGSTIVTIGDGGGDPIPYNNFGNGSTVVTIGDGGGELHTAGRCTVLDPPEVCGDGIDNDNDGLIDEEPDTDGDGLSDCGDADDDGDGFSDEAEAALGTDPLSACPIVAGAHAAWPPDFDDDRAVDLSDVLALKPVYGSQVPAAAPRYDLAPGGGIDISDVLSLKPYFGASCAP